MPQLEFICLANSRKDGGRCVAGLRVDNGEWIRVVYDWAGGSLPEHLCVLDNGSAAQPLDLIRVGLVGPAPHNHHVENWLVDRTPWILVSRPAPVHMLREVSRAISTRQHVFGDISDRVPVKAMASIIGLGSLQLVKPDSLSFNVTPHNKKRAVFQLGKFEYNLALTDTIWETRLGMLGPGSYALPHQMLTNHEDALLTVSLGESFNEDCYKLVAGVIPVTYGGLPSMN